MDVAAHTTAVWSLIRPQAALRCGRLLGHIDVVRPDLGFGNILLDGAEISGNLLSVRRVDSSAAPRSWPRVETSSWPLPVSDTYVRGADLVAAYQPSDDWPFSPQIYWRAGALSSVDGLLASFSLLVSVQTHLLDTWPRISVSSRLPTDETLQVTTDRGHGASCHPLHDGQELSPSTDACCILRRLTSIPVSYVEFMPASDFCVATVRGDEEVGPQVKWELFAEFLEKGVIRRARLETAFVPRAYDVELAAACCEAIERCALPLTT